MPGQTPGVSENELHSCGLFLPFLRSLTSAAAHPQERQYSLTLPAFGNPDVEIKALEEVWPEIGQTE